MVIVTLAALLLAAGTAGVDRCAGLLPPETIPARIPGQVRAVNVGDLLRLRDFGQIGPGIGDEALFTISPDRRQVALSLRSAMPESNNYCLALVVIDIATGRSRVVDQGGDLVRTIGAHGGVRAGFPFGTPAVITPAWSSDGRSITMLKREGGTTQVWRVRAVGGGAEQLTHEAQDVTAFAWSRDDRRLTFRTDRQLTIAQAAIDVEGLGGWHYDDRAFPTSGARPYPPPSDPVEQAYTLDLGTGLVGPPSNEEQDRLDASRASSRSGGGGSRRTLPTVKSEPVGSGPFSLRRQLRLGDGSKDVTCDDDPCANATSFWLSDDGRSVLLLAREGWGRGSLTFYRWTPATHRMARLSTTSDLLIGCQVLGRKMLCARETSSEPRRLVLVDPKTGASRTVFNPNRDYDRLRSGKVERLRLTSANGAQTFADLMLPVDYVAGRHYPMVVVQYDSRGFLRGGTGDEYPIPAFASANMVVLSFQRPLDVLFAAVPAPTTFAEATSIDIAGWADRRNVHSALMDAVNQTIAKGIVDPHRIGITGLSDGLATAAFALLHSDRFSVAALSGCCEEPTNTLVLEGPEFARQLISAGYPALSRPDPSFWKDYSILQNAARVRAPLLIQAADSEYLLSLPTVEALRESGVPVELYVYPGEYHIKWQPAHRQAVWERSLRWFEFWFGLPLLPDQQPSSSSETARWQRLRRDWQAAPEAAGAITRGLEPTPRHP